MARPKKESIIDLKKFVDKQVRVKFQGGREATGKLKGYDHLLNLVLDDTIEYVRDTDNTRNLGLVVCRGPAVTVVCPQDGHESISNPFLSGDQELWNINMSKFHKTKLRAPRVPKRVKK